MFQKINCQRKGPKWNKGSSKIDEEFLKTYNFNQDHNRYNNTNMAT